MESLEGDEMSSYEETGVLTLEYLKKVLPPEERLEKGPVVIIECIEKIPCDPCAYVCKLGAIEKESLVDPPKVDYDKCTGCGECVAICPGLVIFVVNLKYKGDEALLMIPYEFLPTPKRGEIYEALNRKGETVGEARIVAAREMEGRTTVLTLAVKRDLAMIVRNIGRKIR